MTNSNLSGQWSDNLLWEFFVVGELPKNATCSAVYCLAIVEQSGEIVLARMHRGWEMLGGHIEPGETIEQALRREALEEGGFQVQKYALFGYCKVTAKHPEPNRNGGHYPQVAHIPYFLATSGSPLLDPTGEEIIESRPFAPNEIAALQTNHKPIIGLALEKYADNTLHWTVVA